MKRLAMLLCTMACLQAQPPSAATRFVPVSEELEGSPLPKLPFVSAAKVRTETLAAKAEVKAEPQVGSGPAGPCIPFLQGMGALKRTGLAGNFRLCEFFPEEAFR
jgi:hypothetical protein